MWDNRKMARLIELERRIASNLRHPLPVTDFELLTEKMNLDMELNGDLFVSLVDIGAITLINPTTYEPIITLTSEEG